MPIFADDSTQMGRFGAVQQTQSRFHGEVDKSKLTFAERKKLEETV